MEHTVGWGSRVAGIVVSSFTLSSSDAWWVEMRPIVPLLGFDRTLIMPVS